MKQTYLNTLIFSRMNSYIINNHFLHDNCSISTNIHWMVHIQNSDIIYSKWLVMFNIEISGGESIKIKFLFSTGNYQKSFSTTSGTFTKNLFWSRIFKWFWTMNRFMTNLRHFIQSLYLREKGRMCWHPNGQNFGMSFSALQYESFLYNSSIYWSILVYIQLYEVFMKTVAAHPLPWQGDKVLWH